MPISPNTPPGTLVVYTAVEPPKYNLLPKLEKGHVYTIDHIFVTTRSNRPSVALVETIAAHKTKVPHPEDGTPTTFFYRIGNFELAALPKSITEIFTDVPLAVAKQKLKEMEKVKDEVGV